MELEFVFNGAYTYLTVMRMKEIERKHDISLRLMPFSSSNHARHEQRSVPPVKRVAKYMWRDIERRAAKYGFPATVPAPYPLQEFDRANKIVWGVARL